MNTRGLLLRILLCISCLGFCLYSYIDTQNHVTRLRLEIPLIAKEIKDLKETNTRLQYEIDLFESPEHLIQLARTVEFSHLKYPVFNQILTMSEGLAVRVPQELPKVVPALSDQLTFAATTTP